jgi:hypothetical protein
MKINNVSYGSLKIPREEGVGVLHHFQHNFSYWQSVLLVEETGVRLPHTKFYFALMDFLQP